MEGEEIVGWRHPKNNKRTALNHYPPSSAKHALEEQFSHFIESCCRASASSTKDQTGTSPLYANLPSPRSPERGIFLSVFQICLCRPDGHLVASKEVQTVITCLQKVLPP